MRKDYTLFNAQGRILAHITCDEAEISTNAQANGAAGYIEGTNNWEDYYIENGAPVAFPDRPSADHIWDWDNGAWIDPRTLDDLKLLKARSIDTRRDGAFMGGFSPTISTLAVNNQVLQVRGLDDRTNWLTSQAAYAAAIAAGQGALEEAEFRTLSNNTYTLTYAEGFAVLMEMAAWGKAIMRNSWDLKDAVAFASDQTELDAIDIEAGWPS